MSETDSQASPWYLEIALWLIRERGLVVKSCAIRPSGSCYLVVTRPWIKRDQGCKIRLSDHLPPTGRVEGWVHFWTTLASLRDLARYLDAKANRGGGRPRSPVKVLLVFRRRHEGRQSAGASLGSLSGPRAFTPGSGTAHANEPAPPGPAASGSAAAAPGDGSADQSDSSRDPCP